MDILRRFLSSNSKSEPATLPSGGFFYTRGVDSLQSFSECIFKDAELSISRTSTDYCHQLVVRRIYEEGEETLEDELNDERLFLIDERLRIAYCSKYGTTIVSWKDLNGSPDSRFEFHCGPNVLSDALRNFDHQCRISQYEKKYGQEPNGDADLEEFDFDSDLVESLSKTAQPEVSEFPERLEQPETGVTTVIPENGPSDEKSEIEGTPLLSVKVSWCVFDGSSAMFVIRDAEAEVTIIDQGEWTYFICVRNSKNQLLSSLRVGTDMSWDFNYEHNSFLYNFVRGDDAATHLLKFSSLKELKKFQEKFSIVQWQSNSHSEWKQVPEVEQDYVLNAMDQLTLMTSVDSEDNFEDSDQDNTDDDSLDLVDSDFHPFAGEDRNSALEVGHVKDRTYVVRGNRIGVFVNNDNLEYSTTIDGLSRQGGHALVPAQLMLHEQDRALILHDTAQPDKLYHMDLEYGKIVDEWDFDRKLRAYGPSSKFAQTTSEQTFLGLSDNGMFRIDPRLPRSKIVEDDCKIHIKKQGFSALATTEKGYVAIGTDAGDIRLYNKLGKVAKTRLPSLGDKILGLDVTANGRWLLATCATYLLLLNVATADHNGFEKPWPKDSKPRPRRLQITPENAAFMYAETGKPLHFTIARFNTGPDAKETSIVTSTGPYVVTWSLSKIIKGETNSYLIKRYDNNVAADNFQYGTDKRLIVALDNDVGIISRNALLKPSRKTLTKL